MNKKKKERKKEGTGVGGAFASKEDIPRLI